MVIDKIAEDDLLLLSTPILKGRHRGQYDFG